MRIVLQGESKSEIVVPAFKNGRVFLVLDIDSDKLNDFDHTDAVWLQQLMKMLEPLL